MTKVFTYSIAIILIVALCLCWYFMQPKSLVHLIYVPWKDNVLIDNEHDFDHRFLFEMQQRYHVIMWTRSRLQQRYPDLWLYCMTYMKRPVQLVDFFRWQVVHDYGGMYLQYESKLLCNANDLLAASDKEKLYLFTETVLSSKQCYDNRHYRIRRYEPEEPIRVMNQVFYTNKLYHPFVALVCRTILANLHEHIYEDYDVLYLTGNALISRLYDQEKMHKESLHLYSLQQTRAMIAVSSKGSWRMDVMPTTV